MNKLFFSKYNVRNEIIKIRKYIELIIINKGLITLPFKNKVDIVITPVNKEKIVARFSNDSFFINNEINIKLKVKTLKIKAITGITISFLIIKGLIKLVDITSLSFKT